MNINPEATKILCYGDSNIWGYIPATGKRYPANIRWTGLLQEKLGNDFEIIEEGLNSRTTDLDERAVPVGGTLSFLVSWLPSKNFRNIRIYLL